MKASRCILITATIAPELQGLSRGTVRQRREEYLSSLRFYRSLFEWPIYFLENSNYDVSGDPEFKVLLENGVVLLKFPPSANPQRGKGYQEFQVLDLAVAQLPKHFTSFIKLTGRYRVENIAALAELKVNGLLADFHRKTEVAITGCFISERAFYERHISSLFEDCNDDTGDWIERVLYRKIKQEGLWDKVDMFPENPIYKGIPGSHDGTLERHPLKMKLRNAERKVLRALNVHQFPYEY